MMKAVYDFFSAFLQIIKGFLDLVYLSLGFLMNSVAFVLTKLLNPIIDIQNYVARHFILNIKDETQEQVDDCLRDGDDLCKGRKSPMSPELIEKVRDIYKKCESRRGDDPLMLALDLNLNDMAWGFIQCSIQTDTDLHTGERGVRQFLRQENKEKKTALDFAIDRCDVEIVKLLWNNLRSYERSLYPRREAVVSLLHEREYHDSSSLDVLEEGRSTEQNHREQELRIYNRGIESVITPKFLDNFGNNLLGKNASKNTVLHFVSKIGNLEAVKYVLEQDPSQIHSLNSDMETPAFVAVREGHQNTLRYMIDLLKKENLDIESIFTRSTDHQNAWHIAIEYDRLELIFLLKNEIPQLANRVNESNESPLYLAAERGNVKVIKQIFEYRVGEIAFDGPKGKTALHAAAISNSAGCVKCLLRNNSHLINVKDDQGWTPLHHAIYHDSWLATRELLNKDYSIGYHESFLKDGVNTSAIHIAASLGRCKTMKVLMDMCPGCTEFIDNKGRNILHVAIENKKNKAIEFIFGEKSLSKLINQKDKDGNTPIHLLVASDFETMETLMDFRVNLNVLNNDKLTPLDMASSDDQRERLIKAKINKSKINESKINESIVKEEIEKPHINEENVDRQFEIVNNLVVVAALTATASFTAGFTVPGGLDSSEGSKLGTPFLLKKPAFHAFVVANAVSFSFSCSVLLGHIALLFYRNRKVETSLSEQEYIESKIEDMYYLTTWAVLAMTIAFVTGAYVVLTPSLGLAISICVITLLLMAFNTHKDRVVLS